MDEKLKRNWKIGRSDKLMWDIRTKSCRPFASVLEPEFHIVKRYTSQAPWAESLRRWRAISGSKPDSRNKHTINYKVIILLGFMKDTTNWQINKLKAMNNRRIMHHLASRLILFRISIQSGTRRTQRSWLPGTHTNTQGSQPRLL